MEEPNNLLAYEAGLTPEEHSPDGREWEPEEESTMEMDRRASGPTMAESQERLARTLLMLLELAERRGTYGAD